MFVRRHFVYRPDEPVAPPEPTPAGDGTATAEPAAGGTPTVEEIQKRYDDLRPQYDRTHAELNALKQEQERVGNDPEAQRALLREWGYDIEEPVVEEPTDLAGLREQLLAEIRAEIAPVKQTQEQITQERHFAAINEAIEGGVAEIEASGVKLSAKAKGIVEHLALTGPSLENGLPDVKAAYDVLAEALSEHAQAAAQKRRPTHQFTPSGVAGDDKPDLSTHEGRVANAMAKLADNA